MFVNKKSLGAVLLSVALAGGAITTTFAPQSLHAQADLGTLSGIVTDASGATIANATVTVTNIATGAVRTSKTNSKGEYTVTQLNPADYNVSITGTGFGTTEEKVTISVGGSASFSPKLAVAGSKTEVIVSADDTTSVQLEKSEVSTVIETEQIADLPVVDRNPYSLVSLSGNLSGQITGGDRGVGFEIGGARSASVDILLDGAENTDLYAVGVGQPIPFDATQEFSVVVANQGPEYGRASGGAVNVSSKSGTNAFHGDVYEYNRISTFASDGFSNNALYADGDLSNPKSRYTRNQFGYFIGGPIKKDKLFFSSATEWTRIRSEATVISEVALPGLLALSNVNTQNFFSTYGSNLAHPVNGRTYTGLGVQNEGLWAGQANYATIPSTTTPGDISTIAAAETGAVATAAAPIKDCTDPRIANAPICTTDLFGTVVYQNPGDSGGGLPQNQWNNFNRVDWTVSDKTSVFFRYLQLNNDTFPGTNNTSPYAGYDTGSTQKNYNAMASITHSFSSTLASNTKLLATRFNNLQPLGTVPVSPTLYANSGGAVTLGSGQIYFPGYLATSPGNAIPFGGPQNFIQVGEDITWTKGRHSIKIGGEFLNVKDNRVFGAYENAVDALVETGNQGALINFINGNVGYTQVALNPNGAYPCIRDVTTGAYNVTPSCLINLPASQPNFSRSNRYQDGALYVGDTYKVSPRLTLDAGVRWEIYGPQHSQRESYDANFFPGTGGNEFENIRNGQVLTRETSPNHRLWNLNLKQVGPRIGFAFDPAGDGKTSIRAGYSLSYERNFNNVTFNVIQNPPNYAVVALLETDPISTNNLGAFGTGTGSVKLPNTTLRSVDPNIKPAYSQNWSMSIQRQLDPSTLASITYIGSRGVHNYSISNYNRFGSGANYLGDPTATRLNLQYGNINARGADGDSYYESVNVGLRTNNLHHTGLNATVNYTLAHSLDNTSSTFSDGNNVDGGGLVLGYLDPFNHALDHGNSDFDQRHRVTAGVSYNLPFFQKSNGLLKSTLGGWVLGTTFNAGTGNPYTIYDCANVATVCPRASFVAGSAPAKNKNLVDISALYGPNTYSYQTLPAYVDANGNLNTAAYREQTNPITGTNDTPIVGTNPAYDGFVTGMDSRNKYYGPGTWGEDAKLSKSVKVHERYGLELSATFINVFNHANSYLNLAGTNDVSSYQDTLAYKSGNRNTELEARFVF